MRATTILILILCFGSSLLAQNPVKQAIKQSHNALEDSPQEAYPEAWLREPYLTVALDKATVGDITIAFQTWRKDNPSVFESKKRMKDNGIARFMRKLHRWQQENEWDQHPINANERLDAFVEHDRQSPAPPQTEADNRDANWRLLGPVNDPIDIPFTEPALSTNQSLANSGIGRINCIEYSIYDTLNIWVGTSTGGVWKTWNGGRTWINISMNLPIMEISDIAVDQSNSNIIYLATGDRDGQGGYYGNGTVGRLYKTTDGGNNWYPVVGNFGTGVYIENLWIHPKRHWEIVVVKTNGVYKSVDGGGTWTQTLATNYATPFAEPNNNLFRAAAYGELNNPERLYALYRKRYSATAFAYQMRRSDDFGATWRVMDSIRTPINMPSFRANYQKIAIAPSDPNCVYLYSSEFDTNFGADRFGIISRTLNGGSTWENRGRYPSVPNTMGWILGDSTDIGSQGDYNLVLSIDPTNRDKVFLGGVDMWGSTDGGTTFNKTTFWVNTLGQSAHADHHWGEYQPISGNYFLATDGGLFKTRNLTPGNTAQIAPCGNGRNDFFELVSNIFHPNCYTFPTKWDFVSNGISNTDFYALAVSKSDPSIVMGGAQDNGILQRKNGIWSAVVGGWDGFLSVIHPTNPNTFYTTVQFGQTWRTDDGGMTYRFVSGDMERQDAADWLMPMVMDETNPNTVLQGRLGNVWRTTNGGNTWQPISNFPTSTLFNNTEALAIAKSNGNIILAGRAVVNPTTRLFERAIYKTTNGGTTWTNVWNPAFPNGWITSLAIHPTQPNKMWVSFAVGFAAANPDQSRKLFYSEDGGMTWANITAGLPAVPASSVVAQGDSPVGAIYVGTAVGVFYKDNTMSQFKEFQVGMPRGVMVVDLKIHEGVGKVYAATYGRGIWSANLYDRPYDGGIFAPAPERNRSLLLNIYPNPANGFIRINWDDHVAKGQTLSILDMFGRTLHTTKDFQGRTNVDISRYGAGVYTVQLQSDKETVSKKFTVTK